MNNLSFDSGTAYDLFISLEVLLNPEQFNLSPAWAAGMRARLPAQAREVLEGTRAITSPPIPWLYTLLAPKDGAAALLALSALPPAEILPLLVQFECMEECPALLLENLVEARDGKGWCEENLQNTADLCRKMDVNKKDSSLAEYKTALGWWARPEEFGEKYLQAVQTYFEVFFAEEESRIRPVLETAMRRAQELAAKLPFPDLVEELTQGLRPAAPPFGSELVLVPSFWSTPLSFQGRLGAERTIWTFGARPPELSLIPGEAVPDNMLAALKALSDPTRLRILRYLGEENLTPSQLAKRLRLRPPTVVHHLKILRLAGLVQLMLNEKAAVNGYAIRKKAADEVFQTLRHFLG